MEDMWAAFMDGYEQPRPAGTTAVKCSSPGRPPSSTALHSELQLSYATADDSH